MATKASVASKKGQRKLALVIGIGEYENFDQLSNPENDANDMSHALKSIGFTVTMELHLKRVEMKHALVKFEDSIQPGDMVLFYFAGHGTQWEIPYDGHEDGVIRAFVLAGDRLDIPESTPSIFRLVIEQCWAQNPKDRPDACHLIQMIEKCIEVEDSPQTSQSTASAAAVSKITISSHKPSSKPDPTPKSGMLL
ncbi:unnamed protein product [Rotaria sp. Silwood1]|nr:unnamed protein product [Rotaria sp. Silwood1]